MKESKKDRKKRKSSTATLKINLANYSYIGSCKDLLVWHWGTALRYFVLSIVCWVFGSLLLFALKHPIAETLSDDYLKTYQVIFQNYLVRTGVCCSFFIPYFIFCALLSMMWWGLLENEGTNERPHVVDNICKSLSWMTGIWAGVSLIPVICCNAFFDSTNLLLKQCENSVYPLAVLALALSAFVLGVVSCFAFSRLYKDRERADAVRYMVFWPVLCIFGLNLLCGYVCEYLLGTKAFEEASQSDVAWLIFFFAFLFIVTISYAILLFRDNRVATAKPVDPKKKAFVLPSSYHMVVAALIIIACFFFARFDVLIALLVCSCFMAFESWGIISVRRGEKRERYEEAYNIALMIILLLAVPVLSASFVTFKSHSLPGIEAYFTIVSVALVIVSGYFGHYELEKNLLADDESDIDALRIVRRRAWVASLVATVFTVLILAVVPLCFSGEIARLKVLQDDSQNFLDALAAIIGAGSLLSLTVSVDHSKKNGTSEKEKHGDASSSSNNTVASGINPFFTNLRYAIKKRMESYSDPVTYGSKHFHQTFSEAMVACILVAYFLAKVFKEASMYFALFAFTIFIATIITILVDFYLHNGRSKKQAGDVRDKA